MHQIDQPNKPGRPAWLITNHRQDRKGPSHCTAYLILLTNIDQSCVLKEGRVQNSTYGISYYNTLATIWKRCVDNKDTSPIIINSLDSSVKASENLANRSNIVIRLRELIVTTKIQIIQTDKKKISAILEKIRQQTSGPADLKLIKYCWPQVVLRKLCNIRTGAINVQVEQRLTGQLTKIMKAPCPQAECWAKIPLDQLPDQNIVMLTGLVQPTGYQTKITRCSRIKMGNSTTFILLFPLPFIPSLRCLPPRLARTVACRCKRPASFFPPCSSAPVPLHYPRPGAFRLRRNFRGSSVDSVQLIHAQTIPESTSR